MPEFYAGRVGWVVTDRMHAEPALPHSAGNVWVGHSLPTCFFGFVSGHACTGKLKNPDLGWRSAFSAATEVHFRYRF